MLANRVAATPAAAAHVFEGTETSYRELTTRVDRLIGALDTLGLQTGDRIAIWLPNCPAYLEFCLACARLGLVAVAVNTRFRSVEVADIVRRSGARMLVMWPGFRNIDFDRILAGVAPTALEHVAWIVTCNPDAGASGADAGIAARGVRLRYEQLMQTAPCDLDRSAAGLGCNIFTTSGTTSAPKFVLHQQSSITRHALDLAAVFAPVIGDGSLLQALPMCGVFGYTQAMLAVAVGRPMILMSAFDAATAVAAIDDHDVRYMNATDDMVDALLDADPRARALPTVRHCGFAAFNRAPDETVALADARGLTLTGLYGMSEVQALFAGQDPGAPAELRSLGGGRPFSPEAEIRVRNPDTGRLCETDPTGSDASAQGELEVRGPSLFAGYDGNDAATRNALTDDGFLRTGDLGYLIEPGHFVYLARMGDALRLGGFLVSPAEIEDRICESSAVAACQVVAVEHGGRNRAVGFVVLSPDAELDEDGLRQHCESGLARFKVPQRIVAIERFPTTASANGTKIQRNRLRDMAVELLVDGWRRRWLASR